MRELALDLPLIWAALLSLSVFIYVALDGFDLGVGILFPFLPARQDRAVAMNSVAPIWDGNETWLILSGGGLFAAFPLAYAIVMPALYAPFITMLLALVFRGVAFEYRWRDPAHERLWDLSFVSGSLVATFMQGVVLGAFVQGIEVTDRAYAGGWWDWLTPFSLTTGVALCFGYALLGASWLVLKTDGALRLQAYRLARISAAATLLFILVISVWTPLLSPIIYERWFSLPMFYFLTPVPLLTVVVAVLLARAIAKQQDALLYPTVLFLLGLCFVGLGVGLAPYIVPHAVKIHAAAAPDSSLLFMLVGALVMLPLILAYTGYSYWIFRGKVDHNSDGYH